MKAVRITFKDVKVENTLPVGEMWPIDLPAWSLKSLDVQEVRVIDDAVVTVLQAGEWVTLCFRKRISHAFGLYPHVQFHAELDSWEEVYLEE